MQKTVDHKSRLLADDLRQPTTADVDNALLVNITLHADFRPFASVGHTVATVVDTADTLPDAMRTIYLSEVIAHLYGHLEGDEDNG